MGEIIRTLRDDSKPLCPRSTNLPVAEEHMLRNRVLDAFYNAAEKDGDGEMAPPVDAAYHAAAYGPVNDRMDLFTTSASFLHQGAPVVVESWWFRCPVCGFVLPASRMPS